MNNELFESSPLDDVRHHFHGLTEMKVCSFLLVNPVIQYYTESRDFCSLDVVTRISVQSK